MYRLFFFGKTRVVPSCDLPQPRIQVASWPLYIVSIISPCRINIRFNLHYDNTYMTYRVQRVSPKDKLFRNEREVLNACRVALRKKKKRKHESYTLIDSTPRAKGILELLRQNVRENQVRVAYAFYDPFSSSSLRSYLFFSQLDSYSRIIHLPNAQFSSKILPKKKNP